MENDFQYKEINAKVKEIDATFTKKQNFLRQQEPRFETETLFVILSLNVKRRNLATSSSSQFHRCWRLSNLIKYLIFLGVKNVRIYWEFGVKNMEI